jgi:hypothetical protein
MDRQQLNSSLTTLCTLGVISGITTLSILATLPKPSCEVLYNKDRVPERVVGRMNYSGPAHFVSLLSSVAVTIGFGTLLVKSGKKEIEIDSPGEKIHILGESQRQEVNFFKDSFSDNSLAKEEVKEEVYPGSEDRKKYMDVNNTNTTINLTKESLVDIGVQDAKGDLDVVETIKDSTRSVIVASEPGTGKTSLITAVLARIGLSDPDTKIYIVGMKRDSWLGYADIPDRSFVYSGTGESKKELLSFIKKVGDELIKRCDTRKEERNFEKKKVVLLIDDWAAITNTFEGGKEKEAKEILSILGNIYLLGREVFVRALVVTQSFNLPSLGVFDSNQRNCLSLFALIKVTTEKNTSQNDGGIATATNMITNKFVVGDDKERARLLKELDLYKTKTEETNLPAILCIVGARPVIQMLPDLRKYANYRVYAPDEEVKEETKEIKKEELAKTILQPEEVVEEVEEKIIDIRGKLESIYTSPSPIPLREIDDLEKEEDSEVSSYERLQTYIKAKNWAEKKGKSITYIVKYLLRMEGRNLPKGKETLRNLQKEFGEIDFVYYKNKNLNKRFGEESYEDVNKDSTDQDYLEDLDID